MEDTTNATKVVLRQFIRDDKRIDFSKMACFFTELIGSTDFPQGISVGVNYTKRQTTQRSGSVSVSLSFFNQSQNAGMIFFESIDFEPEKIISKIETAMGFIYGDYDLQKIKARF